MGKTATRETYRKEREPRTRRRKIEEARANEVTIPSKQQMSTLITRLESMKDLCDKHGAETVLVSHDDLHHIEVASKLVKQADAMLFSASGE